MGEIKKEYWLGAAALAAVSTAVILLQAADCVDDAYVSFVFARNLADGHGLVFNVGERVEGYSNFLWVLLLAGFHRLSGLSIPNLARMLGLLLGLSNVLLTFGIASKLLGDEKGRWALAAALLAALDLRVAVWSVEGLETPLYLFWVLAALRLYIDREQRPGWLWSIPALGAALTRPEGPVVFMALGAHRLWRLARNKRLPAASDWVALAVFLVPYAAYNAWRIAYFGGYIFPNTFYARGSHGPLIGAIYVGLEAWRAWGPALIIFVGLAVYGGVRPRAGAGAIAAWALVATATVIAVGGDWMPHARFLVPVIPAVVVLAVCGAQAMKKYRLGVLAVTAMMIVQIAGLVRYEASSGFDKRWARDQDGFYMPVAERLKALGASGKLVAISDIGHVAYYADIRVIDTLGLVDTHLARLPGGPAWNTDLDYVLGRNPDFAVNMVRAYGDFKIGHTAFDRAALNSRKFGARYEQAARVPGYDASELSYDDFKRHEYTVEFLIWKRKEE